MPLLDDVINHGQSTYSSHHEEHARQRYAKDGRLYKFQDFLEYYGKDRGPILWDYALPQDLNEATEKYFYIMESYEKIKHTLGISPVARTPNEQERSCCECDRKPGSRRFEKQSNWTDYAAMLCTLCCNRRGGVARSSSANDGASPDHKRVRFNLASEEPWPDWRGSIRVAETALGAPFLEKPLRLRKHYDFIEIGTSDWGTLTQYCAGKYKTYASKLAADIRTSIDALGWARGLSVEPVPEFLQALPVLPRVAKVEAAMGEVSGELILYFVSPETIERHMSQFRVHLPWKNTETGEIVDRNEVDVMWYAKSLSCVGRPHPDLLWMLQQVGQEDLLEQQRVRVLSWGDLCFQHDVGSVDIVQVDCEGMDCAILRGMLKHCDENGPGGLPRKIKFEANHLTDAFEVEATISALEERGYNVLSRTLTDIIVER